MDKNYLLDIADMLKIVKIKNSMLTLNENIFSENNKIYHLKTNLIIKQYYLNMQLLTYTNYSPPNIINEINNINKQYIKKEIIKIKSLNRNQINIKSANFLYLNEDCLFNNFNLANKLNKNLTNYLVFPLNLTKTNNNYGYFNSYFKYKYYYDQIIKKIYILSNQYKIKLVLNEINNYNNYLYWYALIKEILPQIELGIIIDDLYFEIPSEKIKADFVIINLKQCFSNENITKNINYLTFKQHFEHDLRAFHTILKEQNINHFVNVVNINCEETLEKLLIMGFKNFIYTQAEFSLLVNIINKYQSRRGKYRKKITK